MLYRPPPSPRTIQILQFYSCIPIPLMLYSSVKSPLQSAKSFHCHTSEKSSCNSFSCHTSKKHACKSFTCHTFSIFHFRIPIWNGFRRPTASPSSLLHLLHLPPLPLLLPLLNWRTRLSSAIMAFQP